MCVYKVLTLSELVCVNYNYNHIYIETETTICKISFMMLWDHGHPYIQSTPVLCDYYHNLLPEAVCCYFLIFMLMTNVCVQSFTSSELLCASYLCPNHNVLPEGICCCLQTCDFCVSITLINNV